MLIHHLLDDCMATEIPQSQRSMKNSIVSLGGSWAPFKTMQSYSSSSYIVQ